MPEQGKDPTPQGRHPGTAPPAQRQANPRTLDGAAPRKTEGPEAGPDGTPERAETEEEKWAHSRPGPAVREDGAYFYGRKAERE